jgi:tetratricopeptide (TPR) repeat protein
MVGDIATDYIARGLAATRQLNEVYDARVEGQSSRQTRADPRSGRALARGLGAGTLVWGSYYRQNDSLQFEAQIIDARTGKLVLSLEPAAGPAGDKLRVVETLRQRVMAGFATVAGSGFAPYTEASVPPTYEAYQEMLAGGTAGWEFDFDQAVAHVRRAAALDSNYTGAKTLLAMLLAEDGQCGEADSLQRVLNPGRFRLPPVDLAQLEWARGVCQGDVPGQLAAGRAVMAEVPRSTAFGILTSIMALELFRPREAIEILQRLHPSPGSLVGKQSDMYHGFLALAYHELGEHQRELGVVEKSLQSEPNPDPEESLDRAVALAGLRRAAEVDRMVQGWLTGGHDRGLDAQCAALELRAHGHPEEAQRLLERTAVWFRQRTPDQAMATHFLPCLWHLFSAAYYAGNWEDARAGYTRLAARDTASEIARAALGALAARRGDRPQVQRIDAWLAGRPRTVAGRSGDAAATLFRARLAALLGDKPRAVALLRESFERGLKGREYLHLDPDLDALRGYPPFEELVRLHQ